MTDFTDIKAADERMHEAEVKTHSLVSDLALARTVKDYDSERRKTLLSKYAEPLVESGRSQPQAECIARASKEYETELAVLRKQYEHAQRIIAIYDAWQCSFDAARSRFSLAKQLMGNIRE